MRVSRLPSGSATKVVVNEPESSAVADAVRAGKFPSGSVIPIEIAAFAANPLPVSVTVSAAW